MAEHLWQNSSAIWKQFGGVLAAGLRIVATAWIAIALSQRSIRTLRARIATRFDDREAVQRAETLGRAFRYLAAVVISAVATMLVLAEIAVVIRARFRVAPLEQCGRSSATTSSA